MSMRVDEARGNDLPSAIDNFCRECVDSGFDFRNLVAFDEDVSFDWSDIVVRIMYKNCSSLQ